MYKTIFKRVFDLIFSISLFLIASPIFFLVTIILLIVNKGNPFFFQKRPGKNERIFTIIKFKTMRDYNPNIHKDEHDLKRVTRIGSFIRKYSLDEIPQLLNVIIGDMSFVGPRPLLVSYLPLYNDFQAKRHLVRPGITGLAQVNGRNAISWEEKFRFDVSYVENLTLQLDVEIFIKTIKKVLLKEDISVNEETTMEEFKGSDT
ncbi:MAG: sugar transferase [Bacteroidota bacterium]